MIHGTVVHHIGFRGARFEGLHPRHNRASHWIRDSHIQGTAPTGPSCFTSESATALRRECDDDSSGNGMSTTIVVGALSCFTLESGELDSKDCTHGSGRAVVGDVGWFSRMV